MYESRVVADHLRRLAADRRALLTPMQLIKLVYIAHGWMLALYHKPLIRDEVQAWQYGPVIPRLYNAVRKYKDAPVTATVANDDETIDAAAADLLKQVYERYGNLSGPALSRLTHAKGTPWALTYAPGKFGLTIPIDLIEDHYARMVASAA